MPPPFKLAACILLASGAAALGHQLIWIRTMTDLLGAGSQTSARVLGCFFLGLSLGSAIAHRWLRRSNPGTIAIWRAVAYAEFAIAIATVPFMLLPELSNWIWPIIGVSGIGTSVSDLIRISLSTVVLVPPACAVGMTLPLLVQAVGGPKVPRNHASLWLYTIYTAGGALGLMVVTLFLLPNLGGRGSLLVIMTLNCCAGLLCVNQVRKREVAPAHPGVETAGGSTQAPDSSRYIDAMIIALFSGGGVLAFETLGIELINLTAPLAFYPQAAVLITVVVVLALGSGLAATLLRRDSAPERTLPCLLAASGLLISLTPVVYVHGFAKRMVIGYSDTLPGFFGQMFAVALGALGLAVLCSSFIFPYCIAIIERSRPNRFGLIVAMNGLGGLLGAELAYRWLIPYRGVHVALGLLGGAYVLAALLCALRLQMRPVRPLLATAVSATIVLLLLRGPLSELRVFIDAQAYHVLEVRSGRDGSLAIVEREGMGRGMIYNNQYLLGATAAAPDMQRQAHVPLLLHPKPERIGFLGLGTGITASAALEHTGVVSIVAVEISKMVADASARFFTDYNAGLLADPRVRLLVDDARVFVTAGPGELDVCIGDLFTPWRPGEARMASLEQFRAAKRSLRPGGIFCQWFPMHQLTREQFEIISATFREVFPEVYVFRNHFRSGSLPLALVGFRDGALDWEVARRRIAEEVGRGFIRDAICRHVEGLAMLYLGKSVPGTMRKVPLNTLGNLLLEIDCGRNLVTGGYSRFMSADSPVWMEFSSAQLASLAGDSSFDSALKPLPAVGQAMSRWDELVKEGSADARQFGERVKQTIPVAILADDDADWDLWPSGVNPRDH